MKLPYVESCTERYRQELDSFYLTLNHENPMIFRVSEWDPPGRVSVWYLVYRTIMAMLFIINYIIFFAQTDRPDLYLTALTDQGLTVLTVHYLLDMILVYKTYVDQTHVVPVPGPRRMYAAQKTSWLLGNVSTTMSIFITIFYWAFLFEPGSQATYSNVFVHAVNSISCVLDLLVVARPVRWVHVYQPISFGLWYILFSVVYWAAGGTDEYGNPYIYPMLNWYEPGVAIATVFGAAAGVFLVHLIVYEVAHLRQVARCHLVKDSSDETRRLSSDFPGVRRSTVKVQEDSSASVGV